MSRSNLYNGGFGYKSNDSKDLEKALNRVRSCSAKPKNPKSEKTQSRKKNNYSSSLLLFNKTDIGRRPDLEDTYQYRRPTGKDHSYISKNYTGNGAMEQIFRAPNIIEGFEVSNRKILSASCHRRTNSKRRHQLSCVW